MDAFLGEKKEEKKGVNKIMLAAALVALLLVAGGVYLLTFIPTSEELKQQQTAGMFYEGSPELASYTKDIVISTNFDRTSQAKIAIGTIQMAIHGTIRNKGKRTINGLEINVSVVDMANKVIKEKKSMVIPIQSPTLSPNETMAVFIPMDGFKEDDDRANIRWKVTGVRFQ